jgi:hypothetical protein
MEKVLLTFANNEFDISRKQLIKEAKALKIFTKYLNYSPNDLPKELSESLFLKAKKGAGYWIWKPVIIQMALENLKNGDILVYLDSGSTVLNSKEWNNLLSKLNDFESIYFRYNENVNYNWDDFTFNKTKLGYWCHKTFKDFFESCKGDIDWYSIDKILAGAIIVKKTSENKILQKWSDLALTEQQLFADEVIESKDDKFNEHRHDQAVLSLLVYLYSDEKTLIVDEYFETQTKRNDSPFLFTRRRLKKKTVFCTFKFVINKYLR